MEKIQLNLHPEVALDETELNAYIKQLYPTSSDFKITRQSIDARNGKVKVLLDIEILEENEKFEHETQIYVYPNVSEKPTVIVVGAGPAGLFAALRLIELGFKPIVVERGKNVRDRRRDLAAINKEHFVNNESNYCFGEGGAGTYSDGKLYTRSKKRGEIKRILEILVQHGAHQNILVDAHPHIGTNKLPSVVASLREQILEAGGEVKFNSKVIDFIIENKQIKGVVTHDNQEIIGRGVILATGHSARDIFELCQKRNVKIEAKFFAIGVRIEHPQQLIDQQQYSRKDRGLLPPASYSIVAQTYYKNIQRGVFSFCMCPGGFIVPSATANGEVVVNGMSPSKRDSKFANSGLVVAINEPDLASYKSHGPLAGLVMQEEIEQKAWEVAKKDTTFALRGTGRKIETSEYSQFAPAQLVQDFIQKKQSKTLNETSYIPGLTSLELETYLPDYISNPLREGLVQFGNKMKQYASNQGQLIGIESRTSSPVRIPRNKETFEHIEISGLFPCGEGAGYAGGIVSAAMDGERCAEWLVSIYGD